MKTGVLLIGKETNDLCEHLQLKLPLSKIRSVRSVQYQQKKDSYVVDLIVIAGNTEIDRFELCREIKGEQDAPSVLIISNTTSFNEKFDWLDAGADDFLKNPVDYDEIL